MRKINGKILSLISLLFFILTAGCGLMDVFSEDVQDRGRGVDTQAEVTLTALAEGKVDATAETPSPDGPSTSPVSSTPTWDGESEMGMITGSFAYPSEIPPALRIVAFEANNFNNYYYTEVISGSDYSIEIPPGVYFLLAYLINPAAVGAEPGLIGTYSQDVSCSLHIDCSGQSLIPIQVKSGQIVEGIALDVWVPLDEQKDYWPSDPMKPETSSIIQVASTFMQIPVKLS